MFSVHVRNHNLLTNRLNSKIYMLVNYDSVKLYAYFGREVHINVVYLPTKQKLNGR